jgi:hypothetical protein
MNPASGSARLEPLELARRPARLPAAQRRLGAAAAVIAFGAVGAMLLLLFGDALRDPAELLRRLGAKLSDASGGALLELSQFALVFAVAVAHLWYTHRAMKLERIFVDASGLRFRSPLPERLRFLQPDWSLAWSQVRGARVVVPRGLPYPNVAVLELDLGSTKRKLPQVALWAALTPSGEPIEEHRSAWRQRLFSGAPDRQELISVLEAAPLVRYARRAGVAVEIGTSSRVGSGWSLENNRHAIGAALAVLIVLGYGVLDLAVNKESYVADPAFALFAVAGAAVALAGMAWLSSSGVPRFETLGLSLLLGGATAFALYPGALRLNQISDTVGLRAYEYRLTSYVVFAPLEPGLPELHLPARDADYWGRFKLGSVHRFELRKGGLGFYQVDMAPVHARMRAYFTGGN